MDDSNNQAGRPRQRSSIACQACHSRRVRCSAAKEGLPCSNCKRGKRHCRLIESRRNQKRRPLGQQHALLPSTTGENTSPVHESVSAASNAVPSRDNGYGAERASQAQNEGPETLYAKMLENAAPNDTPRNTTRPSGQVMYLGETFNLTYLLQQTGSRSNIRKLHYPLPLDIRRRAMSQYSKDDSDATLNMLRMQGVFTLPSQPTCHELFRVYFEYVQPHYPILNRADFARRYADTANPPSYLLLQSVLLMAVGHCPEDLLHQMGFTSRYEARLTLFKRAKALYDADYETDKVVSIQSIFLMSFWWNSPTDQKDTWHWLGTAISLAITLGMHRSTRLSDMNIRDQRLWKRIWWSLFIEDKHAAAALGRPPHIHIKNCDVEPLHEADFDEEESCEYPGIFGHQDRIGVLYVVHLCRLSNIVEQIIEAHGAASKEATLQSCDDLLQSWENGLPSELLFPKSPSLWTCNLQIAYK